MIMLLGLESDQDNEVEGCISGQRGGWQYIRLGSTPRRTFSVADPGVRSVEA